MNIQTSFIILNGFQLLFLIASVYSIVFMRLRYKVPLNAPAILLTAFQISIFVAYIMHINADGRVIQAATSEGLMYAAHSLLFILLLARLFWLLRNAPAWRKDVLTPQSIREAIDYMPGGICLATPDGRPILTNRRMNELVYILTNRAIMDLHAVWEELRQSSGANGCRKLDQLFIEREPVHGSNDERLDDSVRGSVRGRVRERLRENAVDSILFMFPDDSIWKFHKVELMDKPPHYIQLDASEITDLYNSSKELYENNNRLAEQYARQRNLLANIVEINNEKEILATKMRIHGDFGRSILVTRQHLAGDTVAGNIAELANLWKNTIKRMEDCTRIYADADASPEIELLRAADIVGCSIDFQGDRPLARRTALLFYVAVREALTNAVMHANADRLVVRTKRFANGYHVEISDNGKKQTAAITEGNGLGNLRRRLEQEGATLQVKCEDGIVLKVELPFEPNPLEAR